MTAISSLEHHRPPAGGSDPGDGNLAFPMWNLSEEGTPPPRVAWMKDRPLSFIAGWEPLSFRRRAGYAYTDEAEFMRDEEFSDRALDRYVSAGATSIVIPFAKGFGLKATEAELREEKDIAKRAQAKGLKVGAYVRVDAVVAELVKKDCPDVNEWLVVGYNGRRSAYSAQQTFRKRICYMHPSAIRWLEKQFAYAIREIGADLLHLDGFDVSSLPWETCRCGRCLKAYRRWLKRRFADKALKERVFGIADFDEMEFPEIPPETALPTVLSFADIQAWHLFQWAKEMAFTRHVRRTVKMLGSDIAVSANPVWDRSLHVPRRWGQYAEQMFPWFDAVWTEDQFHLTFRNGSIRSRVGMFKTAREQGIPVCHYHWSDDANEIAASLALSLASNDGNPSCLGFSFRYLPHYTVGLEAKTRYARWAKTHHQFLSGTQPRSEVALVRHFESLAWDGKDPWFSAMGMEQLLVQMQIPWRMFDSLDIHSLRQVRTVILPDSESLSDRELSLLQAWVKEGGRLFFTAKTATHDEFRRRRPRHGILQWCMDLPEDNAEFWFAWRKEDFKEFRPEDGETRDAPRLFPYGKGVLGYWPHIGMPGRKCLLNHRLSSEDLLPPSNGGEIQDFLRKLHGPFSVKVSGPPSLLVESGWQPATGETLLHLIRVDASAPPITELTVHREAGWDGYRILSPDDHPPAAEVKGNTLRLTQLERYAVIAFGKEETK